ncbi:MAG: ATP-binding cassette domain-containing protein [Clostridia bacterium]|nr:ATP-binding cassette domain-containing protein [Clostridia bacterium]
MEQQYILEAKDVSKQFSGNYVLKKVRFQLKKGEIHALVGANGAGKSTFIKIITGAHKCDQGEIIIDGEKANIYSPHCAKQMGISAVYQEFSLVDSLTVAENIFLGRLQAQERKVFNTIDWKDINARAREVLDRMNCDIDTKKLVRDLGVAEKQLVEIAKELVDNSKI